MFVKCQFSDTSIVLPQATSHFKLQCGDMNSINTTSTLRSGHSRQPQISTLDSHPPRPLHRTCYSNYPTNKPQSGTVPSPTQTPVQLTQVLLPPPHHTRPTEIPINMCKVTDKTYWGCPSSNPHTISTRKSCGRICAHPPVTQTSSNAMCPDCLKAMRTQKKEEEEDKKSKKIQQQLGVEEQERLRKKAEKAAKEQAAKDGKLVTGKKRFMLCGRTKRKKTK